MKKPVGIIAVVAVYSLVQIVLLMSTTVPFDYMFPHYGYTGAVALIELVLLIPGGAALFQYLVYGRRGLGKRVLCIYLVGISGLLAFVTPVLLVGTPYRFSIALIAMMGLTWAFLVMQVFRLVRRLLKQAPDIESGRWLEERRMLSGDEIRRRSRAIRFASWIPVTCVLLLFLFFPEAWGVASQLAHRRDSAPGYRISIPAHWFVEYWEGAKEISHVDPAPPAGEWIAYGIVSMGPARAPRRYWNIDVPVSSWQLSTLPYVGNGEPSYSADPLKDARIQGMRTFLIGNETLTCTDYRPAFYEQHFGMGPRVFVYCSGSGRLRASFTGERMHLEEFYGVLQGIRPE